MLAVRKLLQTMSGFDRSELENLSNNSACDIISLVTFVGRVERVKSKDNKGKNKTRENLNWNY